MATTISKNDRAWNDLIKKYHIKEEVDKRGYFRISAEQIKEFREPRLMTKFDHSVNRPQQFKDNQWSILPITRGDYLISDFDVYHQFESLKSGVQREYLPEYIESLTAKNVPSEAVALSCAAASRIIQDFLEEDDIISTISGRMGSGTFSFNISDTDKKQSHKVDVVHSQIEIDGAFESPKSLAIFEAKNHLSDDFIVRQLYYPYRVWKNKVKKTVRPIFFIYSNGIYHLYEYQFADLMDYNSLQLVKQKNYTIEDTTISKRDIEEILNTVAVVEEPEIPFPQADKFERIINLCELLMETSLTKDDITSQYGFDKRQSDYYTRAAMYLNVVEKKKEGNYTLTALGEEVMKMDYRHRQLAFCKQILEHRPFNIVCRLYFSSHEMPTKSDIENIMKDSALYNVEKESTFIRRSSTISGWLTWISGILEDW